MDKIYRVQLNSKGMPNFATAEEVIMCKECKHYDNGDCEHPCSEVGDSPLLVNDDDFCSYGERGEE